MENRINVAELLKDCPKGMELDCTMFDNAKFIGVENYDKPICIRIENRDLYFHLTKFGTWNFDENAKCVIFPKGKDTWEGFQRPAKDGDVVVCEEQKMITQMFVVQSEHKEGRGKCYFGYDFENDDFFKENIWDWDRLATEEERQKLFDAIRAKGYRWNEEAKTLEKPINRNKFVIGATITNGKRTCKIRSKNVDSYMLEDGTYVFFNEVHNWELVPDKFDINTLKIFESKVLVRNNEEKMWRPAIFGGIKKDSEIPYLVIGGFQYKYLIPYEGNEHLTLSNNDCDGFYKTWE